MTCPHTGLSKKSAKCCMCNLARMACVMTAAGQIGSLATAATGGYEVALVGFPPLVLLPLVHLAVPPVQQ